VLACRRVVDWKRERRYDSLVRNVCDVEDVEGAGRRVREMVERRDFVVFWMSRKAREGIVRRRRGCGSNVPVASRYGRIIPVYVLLELSSFQATWSSLDFYVNIKMKMMMMPWKSASVLLRRYFTIFVKLHHTLDP